MKFEKKTFSVTCIPNYDKNIIYWEKYMYFVVYMYTSKSIYTVESELPLGYQQSYTYVLINNAFALISRNSVMSLRMIVD